MKEINKKTQQVDVLWTGGYDSTIRIIDLTKYDIVVQPHYIIAGRKSDAKEISAINKITDIIKNNLNIKCVINSPIIVKVKDIEPNEDISLAYNRLNNVQHLGCQYDWLSRYAFQISKNLELGLQKTGSPFKLMHRLGEVLNKKENDKEFYMLNQNNSSQDLWTLFGRFRFPAILYENTKKEAYEIIKKMGYEEVIKYTWSCHLPFDNDEPCGFCAPCTSIIMNDMHFRFPDYARKRILRRYKYRFYYKIKNILSNMTF